MAVNVAFHFLFVKNIIFIELVLLSARIRVLLLFSGIC
jgi:hypothetical protein